MIWKLWMDTLGGFVFKSFSLEGLVLAKDEKILSASSNTIGNNNSHANLKFNEYLGQANGTNTHFILDKNPTNSEHISIYVNGLLQMPATSITSAPFQDYSVTGSNVFFTTASLPDAGSIIMANYTTNDAI